MELGRIKNFELRIMEGDPEQDRRIFEKEYGQLYAGSGHSTPVQPAGLREMDWIVYYLLVSAGNEKFPA